jgi:hypothetical protein
MNRSATFRRMLLGVGLAALAATASRPVMAQPSPPVAEPSLPVDVALKETPPPHRTLAVEWNPLALFIDRFSVNVVVAPGDHHALVVSPFYTWASTVPYGTNIDSNGNSLGYTLNVLAQRFHGFGGELGYRYYVDKGGPRGLFVGPSVLLAAITATAGDGNQTQFLDVGLAADVGYEALLADEIAISVGAGVQYTMTSKSIPDQQLPAAVYANSALRPRLLLAVGYGF